MKALKTRLQNQKLYDVKVSIRELIFRKEQGEQDISRRFLAEFIPICLSRMEYLCEAMKKIIYEGDERIYGIINAC